MPCQLMSAHTTPLSFIFFHFLHLIVKSSDFLLHPLNLALQSARVFSLSFIDRIQVLDLSIFLQGVRFPVFDLCVFRGQILNHAVNIFRIHSCSLDFGLRYPSTFSRATGCIRTNMPFGNGFSTITGSSLLLGSSHIIPQPGTSPASM